MSIPSIQGRASWIFTEDNFDVDQIVGVKNIKVTDIQELAALAMKSYDPDFARVVQKGDLVVVDGTELFEGEFEVAMVANQAVLMRCAKMPRNMPSSSGNWAWQGRNKLAPWQSLAFPLRQSPMILMNWAM